MREQIKECALVIGLSLGLNITTLIAGHIAWTGFDVILHYHIPTLEETIAWVFLSGFAGLVTIAFGILSVSIDREAVQFLIREWKFSKLTKEFNLKMKGAQNGS